MSKRNQVESVECCISELRATEAYLKRSGAMHEAIGLSRVVDTLTQLRADKAELATSLGKAVSLYDQYGLVGLPVSGQPLKESAGAWINTARELTKKHAPIPPIVQELETADELDAAEDVLAENLAACDAGKVEPVVDGTDLILIMVKVGHYFRVVGDDVNVYEVIDPEAVDDPVECAIPFVHINDGDRTVYWGDPDQPIIPCKKDGSTIDAVVAIQPVGTPIDYAKSPPTLTLEFDVKEWPESLWVKVKNLVSFDGDRWEFVVDCWCTELPAEPEVGRMTPVWELDNFLILEPGFDDPDVAAAVSNLLQEWLEERVASEPVE